MARFLTDEWVTEFNAAINGLDLTQEVAEATRSSLTASSGPFNVIQIVHDVPDRGEVRTVLSVDGGTVSLALGDGGETSSNVTLSLSYDDAAALAQGLLQPAEALGRGRIRVRGDLAVLVASQGVLAAASSRLSAFQAATTY
jgi:putative sterol carrier protein